jgi:entericidin B
MTCSIRTACHAALAMLLATATIALSACNTIEGAGQDLKAGGEAISKTANDVKKKIEE